jgi:signal transduction histidine kinase
MNLVRLIEDIIELQSPHLSQNGIEIQSSLGADLPIMNMDGDKMKQALLNLIKNAGEAMPRGGKLSFAAVKAGNSVVIEITDTGEGIPVDIDAFQPFVTTKKEGTGIGLAVVRQIVIAHNGTISYHSKVGEGTTFRLELPHN